MKFSSYLKAVEADAPPEWKKKFLNYRQLKKKVKGLSPMDCGDAKSGCQDTGPRKGCDREKDAAFFDLLFNEVVKVNREFMKASRKVVSRSHASKPSWLHACAAKFGCFAPPHDAEASTEEIAQRAEWCRRYAQINSVALRKIIKKHDKVCKCRTGADFLQEVWSGHRRSYGMFLHSPMLKELKSLQAILAAKQQHPNSNSDTASRTVSVQLSSDAGDSERVDLPMLPSLELNAAVSQHFERTDEDAKSAAPAAASSEGKPLEVFAALEANEALVQDSLQLRHLSLTSSGLGDGTEHVDNDYMCPICLEAMYQPLGLECGHKFCADCAFSAVGKGNALGTVRAILDHVALEAACPECRTSGVFLHAIELKETERLIKQRYPKAWAERAEEAHEKEQRLRALLAVQRQRMHAGFRAPF
ncbi:hypothetical protein WJX75_008012 [Coccomyxa subellipsoidea]|uniref:RING-type E3 ubiquitin transferase n=1 Tax=Coccomyxa subellipsoidea TaxID=248742 RepID=A0ABR2Z4P8_9CHLO